MDPQIQESTDPVTLYFKDNEDKCAAVLSRDTILNIFSLLLVEPRDAGLWGSVPQFTTSARDKDLLYPVSRLCLR